MKKLLIVFILLFANSANAAISFTDGHWETSFGPTPLTQLNAGWQNSAGLPDGIEKSTDYIFRSVILSDSATPGNNWHVSNGDANEWYYINNLSVYNISSTYGPFNLTVGGVVQWYVAQNFTIGSLTSGQRGWGDADSLGFNTIYIYSTVDPDNLTGKTIAWIAEGGASNYQPGDHYTELSSNSNNTSGTVGSMGCRFIEGDGNSLGTGTLSIKFPSPQKEIWVRWYMRWEEGRAFAQGLGEGINDKLIFFNGVSGSHLNYPLEAQSYSSYTLLAQDTDSVTRIQTAYGFKELTDEAHISEGIPVANNTWHCFEIQYKAETDTVPGIGRIWIDGVLRAEVFDMDWSTGGSASDPEVFALRRLGIDNLTFTSNQAWIQSNRVMYIDYDDIVVYNTTPPNQDALGNPYIGPLGAGPIYDAPTITAQEDFSTLNSSAEISGAYTVDPDLTVSTCTWTLGGNSGFCVALLGTYTGTVTGLVNGANSVLLEIVDSNSASATDTAIITRIKTSVIRGAAVLKGAVIHQ